jgi:hypothetical protein
MNGRNEMRADVCTSADEYAKRLRDLQAQGHQVTMVQFDQGKWVITYLANLAAVREAPTNRAS